MPAQVVMDRFRLLERIGSGGMGTVYRAYDQRLEREVAIKEIEAAEPDRVLREAQAAARLNHPAIATLYEIGERRGRALLVTELVAGVTLARAARTGELTDRELAVVGGDICEALAHAHERGVVHRDVKPANIMVRPRGAAGRRAKLMDFGIASVSGWPTMSATGEVVGTLAYMAPEQAEGLDTGPACDVYSLALTLYEGWAGTNPVARPTPAQTARRIGRPVATLERRRPDLPAELTAMIDACLESDPQARPDPHELAKALRDAARRLDSSATLPAAGRREPGPRRRPLATVLALIAIASAIACMAGPLALPGLALATTLIAIPALAAGAGLALAALPLAAIPLGLLGLIAWLPALSAALARDARGRGALAAAGFVAYLVGAVAIGAGNGLGIAGAAPSGWQDDLGTALSALAGALVDPAAILGAAIFALAAISLGMILRTRLPIAFVAAMIWSAGFEWLLGLIGNGALGGNAAAVAIGAGLAIAIEAHRRAAAVPPRPVNDGPVAGRLAEAGETGVLA